MADISEPIVATFETGEAIENLAVDPITQDGGTASVDANVSSGRVLFVVTDPANAAPTAEQMRHIVENPEQYS